MAKVIQMNSDTLTVDELLKRSCDLKKILVLGIKEDDTEFFGIVGMISSEAIYIMELCKHFIMKIDSEDL